MFTVKSAKLFIAIVETGGLTRAAERLNVTQPAATKALAQLEEQLGGQLFERQSRRLILNAFGTSLLPKARGLVQMAADLNAEAKQWRAGQSGQIKLGVGPSVEFRLLPDVVASFFEDGRQVQLSVRTAASNALLEALKAGHLDMFVGDIGMEVIDPLVEITPLPSESVAALVRIGHPAIEAGNWADYPVATATLPDRARLHPLPFGLNAPSLICDDYTVLARASAVSNHVLAVPEGVVGRLCADHNLVELETTPTEFRVTPAIVRRVGAPTHAALDDLAAVFERVAAT